MEAEGSLLCIQTLTPPPALSLLNSVHASVLFIEDQCLCYPYISSLRLTQQDHICNSVSLHAYWDGRQCQSII
jgi:hypothetical protein